MLATFRRIILAGAGTELLTIRILPVLPRDPLSGEFNFFSFREKLEKTGPHELEPIPVGRLPAMSQ